MHSSYTVLLRCRGLNFSLYLHKIIRIPWMSDRPLPEYRTTQIQNKCTHTKYPCHKWDWNPRSQRPRERREFIPETARPRRPAIRILQKSLIAIEDHRVYTGKNAVWGDNVGIRAVNEMCNVAIKVYFTFSESIPSSSQHGLCIFFFL
jgi:hypothetical protein